MGAALGFAGGFLLRLSGSDTVEMERLCFNYILSYLSGDEKIYSEGGKVRRWKIIYIWHVDGRWQKRKK